MTLDELVQRVPVAMMATLNREQQLTSRPMLAVLAEPDVLWFLTRAGTDKLEEISTDARVNLAFASPKGEYTSVSGRATVSVNREMVQRLWDPTYRAWFPEGSGDPDIVLLRIDVERADYWETSYSRVQRLLGAIKAAVTGQPYEIERKPIDLHPSKALEE